MKMSYLKRIIKLIFGLFLFSLGMYFVYAGDLGLDSWNVFHDGLAGIFGIPIGYMSVIVAIIVLAVAIIMGEKFGLATILDSILVGIFFQLKLDSGILTVQNNRFLGIIYVLIGMEIISLAIIVYMSTGFGAGPRDSFNLALSRITGIKMGYIKVALEVTVVFIGFLLGGRIGIGTAIYAFGLGLLLQLNLDILKFEPKTIQHEDIFETIKNILK